MNCLSLSITSLFLLFPIFYYFQFSSSKSRNIYETILVALLIGNVCLSFSFWMNPIEHSTVHMFDGIIGKISFVLFSIYILIFKDITPKMKTFFVFILSCAILCFYYSNIYSKQHWCSEYHVMFHSMFHYFISIGSSIAFI
jgi:hypothetical protein